MKPAYAIALFIMAGLFNACKKEDISRNSANPVLFMGECYTPIQTTEPIHLCFTKVLSESRCPLHGECIWAGTAIAEFTFTKNGQSYPLSLSTNHTLMGYPQDSVIDGYKIEFVNLYPYPDLQAPPPTPADIKAEIRITRL